MIFALKHPTVQEGVDKEDFVRLLNHSTELIKDVKKFSTSIALVVIKVDNSFTKVQNSYASDDENDVFVKDAVAIDIIETFLKNLKIDLGQKLVETSSKEYLQNSIDLINIFLTKKNDKFPRISLFQRPDEPGP